MFRLFIICFTIYLPILPSLSWDPCEIQKTCGDCVRDINNCKWCSMDDYNGVRCKSFNDTFGSGCDSGFIENPDSRKEMVENRTYSSNAIKVTQIRPQKYHMVLRPGRSLDFNISFKGADDYPADLYFLIDVSNSMTDVKSILAKGGKDIYNAMLKNTKNVFLGLGSFIDKDTPPFVKVPSGIYSFKHRLSLTNNFEDFEKAVIATPLGVNYDDPEGGFDALAQVLACDAEIGWREKSRKIIIFFTDELCHSAGDGRIAGITQPYDGKCYTDKNGTYTKELLMDYPSISMINKLASTKDATILFAIKEDQKNKKYIENYEYISSYIIGSKCLSFKIGKGTIFDEAQLANTLSVIYKEISETILFKLQMSAEERKYIKISFEPECGAENKDNPDCIVKHGEEKHFRTKVQLLKYFKKPHISVNITIKGTNEMVTLDIDVPGCECETDNKKVQLNSAYCHGKGTKKCGICECDPDRVGDRCRCKKTDNVQSVDNSTCIPPIPVGILPNNLGETNICSDHGSCNCGTCECQPSYHGKYCECQSDSCLNKCNNQGDCPCGKCFCYEGYTGEACECSTKPCNEINGKICNGRGTCSCAKCDCSLPESWDARYQYTENCVMMPCPDCHLKQCHLLQECVSCYYSNNDFEKCISACQGIIGNVTEKIEVSDVTNSKYICQNVRIDLGCYTNFQYQYDDDKYGINLLVQTDMNCIEGYYWYAGISLIILIVIGLLTLVIWKVLTELQDRREYNRFIKEHAADTTKCENPIYEPATTTFNNPVFRKKSVDSCSTL